MRSFYGGHLTEMEDSAAGHGGRRGGRQERHGGVTEEAGLTTGGAIGRAEGGVVAEADFDEISKRLNISR